MAHASRGVTGAPIKLCGGDYPLTVTGRTELTPNYLRVHFTAERLLAEQRLHPTMWVRGWFADGDKVHQRGCTLVHPDRDTGTVDLDFTMHDGVAARWAGAAKSGDVLEVTVLDSIFALPEPGPAGYIIVGDTASLPAINSLLDAIGDAPARVFLEAGHDDDRDIPVVGAAAEVTWVDRDTGLVEAVSASAFDAGDHFGWVACNNRTTRAVAKVFREEYGIRRGSIKAQAYRAA